MLIIKLQHEIEFYFEFFFTLKLRHGFGYCQVDLALKCYYLFFN